MEEIVIVPLSSRNGILLDPKGQSVVLVDWSFLDSRKQKAEKKMSHRKQRPMVEYDITWIENLNAAPVQLNSCSKQRRVKNFILTMIEQHR